MSQSVEQNWTGKNFSIDDESIPEEIRVLIINLIRICPFRIDNKIDLKDIPIFIKRDNEGCFFTCQVCTVSQCSGYIKDDPQNS